MSFYIIGMKANFYKTPEHTGHRWPEPRLPKKKKKTSWDTYPSSCRHLSDHGASTTVAPPFPCSRYPTRVVTTEARRHRSPDDPRIAHRFTQMNTDKKANSFSAVRRIECSQFLPGIENKKIISCKSCQNLRY